MTQAEAAKKTKYFSEGVKASIWCYSGDGDWGIDVNRNGRIWFSELDEVLRSVHQCRESALTQPELRRGDYCVEFESVEAAEACIAEIAKAVLFIQSQTRKTDWFPAPALL